jgi:CspA family cold shock protein
VLRLVAVKSGQSVFLHLSVLKAAGYVWIPRGTTLRIRFEEEHGKPKVAEVLEVDTSTSHPGEKAPILRKSRSSPAGNVG